MKTAKKISALFLAFILLVSSLGFTANKIVCFKSCESKLSLVNIKDCCPEQESHQPAVKSDCCDITNTIFILNDFRTVQESEIAQPIALKCFLVNSTNESQPLIMGGTSIISFADLPPPRSGRTLLSFISLLTI